MNFLKRAFLFVCTNLAIILVLSLVVFVLEHFLGIRITRGLSGWYTGLFVFSAIFGFVGSFVSLAISRWIAKRTYGIELMSESRLMDYSAKEQLVYTTVAHIARQNGIDIPEVGVYESADPNAFATGPSRNSALVAVSSGLLECMTGPEIEWVVAHEMTHILNGDMVTMTLLQGVLNTFVIFFARVIGAFIDQMLSRDSERGSGIGYFLSVMLLETLFGILASIVLMAFSRYREYRADEGSARAVGKDKMIQALKRLQAVTSRLEMPDDGKLATFKIHHEGGFMTLLMSHPRLEDRIANLERQYL